MNMVVETSFYLSVAGTALFFFGFGITSIREKRIRAALLSFIIAIIIATTGILIFNTIDVYTNYFIAFPLVLIIFALLFFAPIGKNRSIEIQPYHEKVDERDTMFARAEYKQGTEKYDSYYARHPELKDGDDKIRKLPGLLSPNSRYYDEERSGIIEETFQKISSMTGDVDGQVNPNKESPTKNDFTVRVKQMILDEGADDVGIAYLNQQYVYSHVGRGPEPYGAPINNNHKFVAAFTIEMRYDFVEKAPDIEITEETARGYLKAANISVAVAKAIREMGYPARAHISDSNYQIMLPAVAYEAGLGELGRHGYIISPRFGSRIRLGAITTDLPLATDNPINFGVQGFCDKCIRCSQNCPSAAIPFGQKKPVRGITKWMLGIESCFRYWRSIGTDCGLCMKVCPFSHPPTFFHNLVRRGIKNSAFARIISVYGENIIYGKRAPY